MNILPVITRELRVQARQPFTFRFRIFGVLSLLVSSGWFLSLMPSEKNVGGILFALLHGTLFYAALVLVTFSAVDCLSRERRDGTLGLLFLTPLSAVDIVLAKVMAHAARALTLVLAVIPIFALPMLLGGVAWQQLAASWLLIFSVMCIALGAALAASAACKRWSRALALALVLAGLGLMLLSFGLTVLLYPVFARSNSNFALGPSFDFSWLQSLSVLGSLRLRLLAPGWSGVTVGPLLPIVSQVAVLALVWLLGAMAFAAIQTRRAWREEPPSARRQWMERKLTTPVVGLGFYQFWMRGLLERNPVGWLERRSWQGRLVMWTWLAIVITVTTSVLGDSALIRAFANLQRILSWLLVLSVAGTVAGSFRRERETGVLELLLISPLGSRRIILGRLLGLWGQFLPAVLVFVLVWVYIASLLRETGAFPQIAVFLLRFATLPVVGLYFSLRCQSFIGAFLLTLATVVALPSLFDIFVQFLFGSMAHRNPGFGPDGAVWGLWLVRNGWPVLLALLSWRLLNLRLERREFEFDRAIA